jgi:hypothetical protein
MDVLLESGLFSIIPASLADAGLLFVFLLAAGVTAMASVGFVLWLGYQIARVVIVLLARLILLPVGGPRRRKALPLPAIQWLACPDPVCRTVNPEHARFCRQCGRMVRRPAQLPG